MNYPLIKKWLELEVQRFSHIRTSENVVNADELEAKLAEGFEVYGYSDQWSNEQSSHDTHTGLIISKHSIKKKTREEAALEFVQKLSKDALVLPNKMILEKAKEIFEMK